MGYCAVLRTNGTTDTAPKGTTKHTEEIRNARYTRSEGLRIFFRGFRGNSPSTVRYSTQWNHETHERGTERDIKTIAS